MGRTISIRSYTEIPGLPPAIYYNKQQNSIMLIRTRIRAWNKRHWRQRWWNHRHKLFPISLQLWSLNDLYKPPHSQPVLRLQQPITQYCWTTSRALWRLNIVYIKTHTISVLVGARLFCAAKIGIIFKIKTIRHLNAFSRLRLLILMDDSIR